MKKLLLIGGLAIGGFMLFAQNNKTLASSNNPSAAPTFFEKYEGKIVIDSIGNWLVIQGGRIYTFTDQFAYGRWALANPINAIPVKVDFPAWDQYANSQVGGVSILPGY